MVRYVIAVALLGACYSPSYKDCQFQCSSASTCPDGLECTAGVCRLEGLSGPCVAGGDDGGGIDGDSDSAIDALPPELAWSTPAEISIFGTSSGWSSPTLVSNESEMFLESASGVIFRTTVGTGQIWTQPVIAGGLMAPAGKINTSPMLTRDGKAIYFGSDRNAANSFPDVFVATRPDISDASFSSAQPVLELNVVNKNDSGGSLTANGQLLLFTSDRSGDAAIYQSVVTTGAVEAPTLVMELDSQDDDTHASISGDGLTVVFSSNRLGADFDIYLATRTSTSLPFDMPRRIPALSQPAMQEVDPWLSEDGRVIYFGRGIAANRKIVRSTRL